MTFRIAYSTNAYTRWTLPDAIRDVRERGFDGVEILADDPHAFPPGDPPSIRKALSGFPVSNLNGNTFRGKFTPSLIDPDSGTRGRRVEYIRGVIDLAREIGADTICTSSGFLPKGVEKNRARALFSESLREILGHAEREPRVRVGIEYEPGFFVGSAETLLPLLREIDHPLLGVNLDIGHAVCVGEDPEESIEAFAGRTWNMHIEDIEGREHRHRIPGEGSIDFEGVGTALQRTGYDGFVTLEIYPYKDRPGEAGTESLRVLRSRL